MRAYPRPTEKGIREQRVKTAALAANDGLTPAQGGGSAMLNELGAIRPIPRRLRMTNNTSNVKGCMQSGKAHTLRVIQTG